MKEPAELAGPHVERSHIAPEALLTKEVVRHRLAEDDDIAHHRGCAAPTVTRALLEPRRQIHAASLSEYGWPVSASRAYRYRWRCTKIRRSAPSVQYATPRVEAPAR